MYSQINIIKKIAKIFHGLSILPLLIPFALTSEKETIRADVDRWKSIDGLKGNMTILSLIWLLTQKEFRTLFYHRTNCGNFIGALSSYFFKLFYKPMYACFITTKEIGPGLYLQHGFSTIISARKIGFNAWINQQVTIGYTNKIDCPTIGNNVYIGAGAKVLGDVHIGDNVTIGANAVVVKDVPANCTFVGVPAEIIKKNGKRVIESTE